VEPGGSQRYHPARGPAAVADGQDGGRGHAQTLDITLSGASRGNVRVDRAIAAQVSGASTLTYTGTPQFTKRDTSGASSIQPA
jgi:hypothetical protein